MPIAIRKGPYRQIWVEGWSRRMPLRRLRMVASAVELKASEAVSIVATEASLMVNSQTSASGPTGNRYGDDAGHACIAVSGPVERSITIETGASDRQANMRAFAQAAYELLERCIREAG